MATDNPTMAPATAPNWRRIAWLVLRLTVVVVILGVLFSRIDRAAFMEAVRGLRPGYIAASLGMYLVALVLVSLRWKVLIDQIAAGTSLVAAFVYNLVGVFYTQFLPGSLSGDVVRGYYLSRTGSNRLALGSSALVDRVIGMTVNGFIGVVALAFSPFLLTLLDVDVWLVRGIIVLVPLGIAAGYAALWLVGRYESRMPGFVANLYRVFRLYADQPRALVGAGLLSALYFGAWAVALWLLAMAANITQLDMITMLLVLGVVNVAQVLPISINGWGVREGLMVFLLGQFGVASESAIVFSLLIAGISIIIAVFGALFVAVDYRQKPGEDVRTDV